MPLVPLSASRHCALRHKPARAKALGCWVEDGKPSTRPPRPAQLSPRDALSLIADDANYLAIFTGLLVNGKDLTESDREAALDAVARILKITGMYQ